MAWHCLCGWEGANDDLVWRFHPNTSEKGLPDVEGLWITVLFQNSSRNRFTALERAKALVKNTQRPTPSTWIVPGRTEWTIDLEALKDAVSKNPRIDGIQKIDWLHGRFFLVPQLEHGTHRTFDDRMSQFSARLLFYVPQDLVGERPPSRSVKRLKHEDRWEFVRDLGEGGQGKVSLVREISKWSRSDFAQSIRESLGDANHTREYERGNAAETLVDSILSTENAADPSILGALKVLHPLEDAKHDPEAQKVRIEREIEAMRRVSHPSLLKIRDEGCDEFWFVSEYHPNKTLADRQQMFAGDVQAALTILRSIVEGVAELHKEGFVHRDIKPGNIFVSADNRCVLGDFGLIFFTDDSHTRVSDTLENVGSWDWMPEWAKGIKIEEINPTFDVFSLGKVLWWMVSGLPVERLRLWYFNDAEHPDLDVENLFVEKPHIRWLNPLLAKCVVQYEKDCLVDAAALLREIDKCLSLIERQADQIGDDIERICRVCGIGTYNLNVDRSPSAMRNFGIDPKSNRSFKIFVCGNCGHVELFYFGTDRAPPAWSNEENTQ